MCESIDHIGLDPTHARQSSNLLICAALNIPYEPDSHPPNVHCEAIPISIHFYATPALQHLYEPDSFFYAWGPFSARQSLGGATEITLRAYEVHRYDPTSLTSTLRTLLAVVSLTISSHYPDSPGTLLIRIPIKPTVQRQRVLRFFLWARWNPPQVASIVGRHSCTTTYILRYMIPRQRVRSASRLLRTSEMAPDGPIFLP